MDPTDPDSDPDPQHCFDDSVWTTDVDLELVPLAD